MKNKKTALLLVLGAILLVAATMFGTVAYLTSKDTVTNTFTVGNVAITLDETDVDVYGVKDTENRVKENVYKLIPGHTYVKDPTVHVAAISEAAWLFVKVEDGIAAIQDTTTIAKQLEDNEWVPLDGVANVYTRAKVESDDEVQNFQVFGSFTLTDDATVSAYASASIVVTAYAVQADGFETAKDAWTATAANFGA